MSLSLHHRQSGHSLLLENKPLNAFKHPEKDEQDTDILNPSKLDGLPEARAIGERSMLRNKLKTAEILLCEDR